VFGYNPLPNDDYTTGSSVPILITGASGFVGQHLITSLRQSQPDEALIGTMNRSTVTSNDDHLRYVRIDLCDTALVKALLDEIRPSVIYHLAGQSSPAYSFEAPWETLETNIRSQFNILQGCHELGLTPRILVVTSAEIYGTVQPEELPITEDAPLRPASPYSLSKITQDMMGWQYYLCHQLPVIRARAFNHPGPGQSERFVITAFAMQVARIEAGLQEPIIQVGNLSAQRDFTDVRDVVRAYQLLIERGQAGEAYNIASNQAISIAEVLAALLSYSRVAIRTELDVSRLRPADIPCIQGSYAKLNAATGWTPQIPFTQSLQAILEDCRQRVQNDIRRSENA
jgi:GDP-4-dehydro-6-deoxy-D-mannose reductase